MKKTTNVLKIAPSSSGPFYKAIEKDINFRGRKLWILGFAAFIASIGLNMNNSSVVIGAMLISPIMGPVNGIGYATAILDFRLLGKSVKNLAIAIGITLLVSSLYFFFSPDKKVTPEILSRTTPSFFHAMIAIGGGAVGILAKSRKENNNVVPGVAIATALLPPLCSTGFGLVTGRYRIAGDSMLMFGLYVLCMGIASGTTSKILRYLRTQVTK